ncbi:hypothetical protein MFLO_04685 [Listeria floridensis FSL S10-1187]|uniref:Activator of Hsp90 ATPase 1 family protein n=1 Tax=Listeria floridensis FSL S10-1187 TaxID=1265817 RepID=A0ABN0RH65_9LIST|nr:hypothetical protein [Listeria floridensis]EUJ33202.1 hypothetical protein MFLO_04685 [Listeria floridensis FSL S10-1187]
MKRSVKTTNDHLVFEAEIEVAATPAACWKLLTTTTGLRSWFDELEVGELSENGYLLFVFKEAETVREIKLPILEFDPEIKIGFGWDQNEVFFKLVPLDAKHTRLLFRERILVPSEHTARDLSGWTLCLDAYQKAAEGREYEFDQARFAELLDEYNTALS